MYFVISDKEVDAEERLEEILGLKIRKVEETMSDIAKIKTNNSLITFHYEPIYISCSCSFRANWKCNLIPFLKEIYLTLDKFPALFALIPPDKQQENVSQAFLHAFDSTSFKQARRLTRFAVEHSVCSLQKLFQQHNKGECCQNDRQTNDDSILEQNRNKRDRNNSREWNVHISVVTSTIVTHFTFSRISYSWNTWKLGLRTILLSQIDFSSGNGSAILIKLSSPL